MGDGDVPPISVLDPPLLCAQTPIVLSGHHLVADAGVLPAGDVDPRFADLSGRDPICSGATVELGDGRAVAGDHQGGQASVDVGLPGRVQLRDEPLAVAAADPLVLLVGADRVLATLAEQQRGLLLPGVTKPAHVGELRGARPAVADQGGEHAARLDGGELVGVADQQQLRAGVACGAGELLERERSGQRGLVDDHDLTGAQRPALELLADFARPHLGHRLRRAPGARGRAARLRARRARLGARAVLAVLVQPFGGVLRVDPELAASTSAAAADGARPSTEPAPCARSHTARRPAIVVLLPVPAGPTSTSSARPLHAIFSTANAWSTLSPQSRPGRFSAVTCATTLDGRRSARRSADRRQAAAARRRAGSRSCTRGGRRGAASMCRPLAGSAPARGEAPAPRPSASRRARAAPCARLPPSDPGRRRIAARAAGGEPRPARSRA